jgi:hypothetical protein
LKEEGELIYADQTSRVCSRGENVFEILRPEISEGVEAQLMRQVRAIIADENDDGS